MRNIAVICGMVVLLLAGYSSVFAAAGPGPGGTDEEISGEGTGLFVDGNDYDLPANFDCTGSDCIGTIDEESTGLAGVYFENAPAETVDPTHVGSSITVGGGTTTAEDWEAFADSLIPYAETLSLAPSGVVAGAVALGTRDAPQVSYIAADTTFSGSVDGAGILIIEDGATFQGTMHYEGLIIVLTRGVESDEAVELDLGQGNSFLYGAVIVAGENPANVNIRGNAQIRYSKDALDNVKDPPGGGPPLTGVPTVMSWRQY